MVHRGVVVYAGDGDGEETPVSTDVLQALPVVGARDEGAVAGQGEGFDVVGLALRHVVLRMIRFNAASSPGFTPSNSSMLMMIRVASRRASSLLLGSIMPL